MSSIASLTERTFFVVDLFVNRPVARAWASVCRDKLQPPSEEDYGGGDICSLEERASTQDDQPLD
jgi:hypothetical protein